MFLVTQSSIHSDFPQLYHSVPFLKIGLFFRETPQEFIDSKLSGLKIEKCMLSIEIHVDSQMMIFSSYQTR